MLKALLQRQLTRRCPLLYATAGGLSTLCGQCAARAAGGLNDTTLLPEWLCALVRVIS